MNNLEQEDNLNQVSVLLGDIGGTNSRLQLVQIDRQNKQSIVLNEQILSTQNAKSFNDIIQQFQNNLELGLKLPKICHFGFAGPIINQKVNLQNAQNLGVIDSQQLKIEFNFEQVYLYNDFEIASYAIFGMDHENDFYKLNDAIPQQNQIISVCGPGTGLGRATLVPYGINSRNNGTNYKAWPSEGGSCSFFPINTKLFKYYQFIQDKKGEQQNQIILENCATGLSIPYMYMFIKQENPSTVNTIEKELGCHQFLDSNLDKFPNKEILKYGMENRCQICYLAFSMFLEIFETIIGDIMLQSMCFGGLFILGNIGQSIGEYLFKNKDIFLSEYKKSRQSLLSVMDQIPIYIIKTQSETGLQGALNCAKLRI